MRAVPVPLRRFAARHEGLTITLLVLVVAGVWGFVELADEVLEGSTEALDRSLLLALRVPGQPDDPLGPPWVEEMARDFTAIGGVAVLVTLTVAAAGYLLLRGQPHAALGVLVAIGGGLLLGGLLKAFFSRPRPELVPHLSHVSTSSFPSNHSLMSAVTYLTLAALMARFQPCRRVRVYFVSLAVVLTVLVGMSRVYVGVHWPTDVLAGWLAGGSWALLSWYVFLVLQRHGRLEGGGEAPSDGEART